MSEHANEVTIGIESKDELLRVEDVITVLQNTHCILREIEQRQRGNVDMVWYIASMRLNSSFSVTLRGELPTKDKGIESEMNDET